MLYLPFKYLKVTAPTYGQALRLILLQDFLVLEEALTLSPIFMFILPVMMMQFVGGSAQPFVHCGGEKEILNRSICK